jgi:energy-coupling factor transport system ATP-binding protein
VSLIVSPGEAVLITGGNGSGKTTLSRLLTGLIAPTWGRCTLGGTPVAQRVGDVAMSMQFARLQLQRPSVRLDILAAARAGTGSGADAGVRSRGRRTDDTASRPAQDRLVRSAMDEVGLPLELERRGIDQLSGGQMRRVALAGLLASEPRVIVLDEPLAGLDADSRLLLIDALERRRRRGLAIVVISHDTDGLDALCQRSLTLAEGTLS